jgi:formylglycine-generating enzyme required for sulfatase activity
MTQQPVYIYENFDVRICSWDGEKYVTQVIHSPHGEAQGELALKDHAPGVIDALPSLQHLIAGEALSEPERLRRSERIGDLLYDALMAGEIKTAFDVSYNTLKHRGKGLRIRLRIEAPEISALPWELMRAPRGNERDFLALSTQTPIVRYIEMAQTVLPLNVNSPIRILVVVSSPNDQRSLDVEAELAQIRRALDAFESRGLVQITVASAASVEAIQNHLLTDTYHILHYTGHGDDGSEDHEGCLIFEDSERLSCPISGRRLGRLLQDIPTLRLVVLNACSTSQQSRSSTFSSVANALVDYGIPAVLAMQTVVSDEAALNFSKYFYETLALGEPVDRAVAQGRKMVDALARNTLEWAIPQLFMRVWDGVLFNLSAATDARQPASPGKTASQVSLPQGSTPTSPAPRQRAASPQTPVSPGKTTPQAPSPPQGPISTVPPSQQTNTKTPPTPPKEMQSPKPAIIMPSVETDPTKPMQLIPGSEFIHGKGKRLYLPDFYIDTYPVTNADYLLFIQLTGANIPVSWPRSKTFPREKAHHPVTGISWNEAMEYAQWIGKRLPTASEWEKAARGVDGRKYPWGNVFNPAVCNTQERGLHSTTAVNQFPQGASPYGVMDMIGNVWEWVSDNAPSRGIGGTIKHVIKGGAFNAPQNVAECVAKSSARADARLDYVGFRCAYSP